MNEITTEAEASNRIIWGMGLPTVPEIRTGLQRIPQITKVKYGRKLYDNFGPVFMEELIAEGYNVFDDAKLIEIPTELWELARSHAKRRPWMLNCMLESRSSDELTGKDKDGIRGFVEICGEYGVKSCGVTVLTSKKHAVVRDEFKCGSHVDPVLRRAEIAIMMGVEYLVCSPEEAEAVIKRFGPHAIKLVCPGIKMPNQPPNPDQPRSFDPGEAIAAGVDELVINRAITIGDVAANLKVIIADMLPAAA